MATSAGAFFAGIGTTFVILAVGFGGGLFAAKSALNEPGGFQRRSTSEIPAGVRVVLPSSAEAAPQPAELPQHQAFPSPVTQPASEATKSVQLQADNRVEKVETLKFEADSRDRKRRYAERKKAKQAAEARARRNQQRAPQQETPVLAAATTHRNIPVGPVTSRKADVPIFAPTES
jgi:hypothetical protein